MKKVVSPQQVAHLFANQLQSEARNANNNLYFYNESIYSYGNHFCIAKFLTDNTLLFTERSYSNTTSNHISIVRSATSHKNKIYCAYPQGSHEQNFNYWLNEAESVTRKLTNAKKPEIYLNQLNIIKDKATIYATYFNIGIPQTLNSVLSITDKKEVVDYLAKKEALLLADKKAKEQQQLKAHKEALKKWRKFDVQRLYSRDGFDYIRKNDENFETSQGVKFPIAVGMRFYNNLKNVNVGDKFLDFTVNEITKQYITIGCHKITFKEIENAIK